MAERRPAGGSLQVEARGPGRRETRLEVERRLRGWFRNPETPIDDAVWQETALLIFRLQFEGNEPYRRFCQRRRRTPEEVEGWEDIPLVPATAFKHLDLYSGPGPPEGVFVTSGTTGGAGTRGRHPVASMALYKDASVPWFASNLVPEGGRLPVLSLVPDSARAPSSSLSTMMGLVVAELGTQESGFFADPGHGVDAPAFHDALTRAAKVGEPILVMGTAFAWVHWLDWCAREGSRVPLPHGSRLMETGGFKGRARSVSRVELYSRLEERLGIPSSRMVNEYGMTELLSQLYEPVLRVPGSDPRAGHRIHVPPPWLRVRALDPETLAPLPSGSPGLLAFFDPANLGSVSALLTEDVGVVERDGVRLAGRAEGSEPRGCSLAMEDLLGGAP